MIDNKQTLTDMSYTRFDRHENMSSETREEILDLINSRPNGERLHDGVRNRLFGLFNGYFYDMLVEDVKDINDEEFTKRMNTVIETVSEYPTIQTTEV